MRPTFPDKKISVSEGPKVGHAKVTQQSRFLPFTFLSPLFFAFLFFFFLLLDAFRLRFGGERFLESLQERNGVVKQDFHRNFWVSLTIVFLLFGALAHWI